MEKEPTVTIVNRSSDNIAEHRRTSPKIGLEDGV